MFQIVTKQSIKTTRFQYSRIRFNFCNNPDNKDYKNVTVNLDGIRKRLLDRETQLPLRDPTIIKPGEVYDSKSNKRKTERIFDFIEPGLGNKDGYLQVYGLQNGYFSVNDIWYPGSILVFPRQIFMWEVQTAADIRSHCFDILEYIKPFPTYVIIGTGKDKVDLPDSFFDRFHERGIRVDVVPTFEACSHFNFCSEEMRQVCAFLIPTNL